MSIVYKTVVKIGHVKQFFTTGDQLSYTKHILVAHNPVWDQQKGLDQQKFNLTKTLRLLRRNIMRQEILWDGNYIYDAYNYHLNVNHTLRAHDI